MTDPTTTSATSPPGALQDDFVNLDRAEVKVSLRCVECGYDVRGLKAGGKCPECGHAVLETVQASIDAAGSIPLLPNAPNIGRILFGLLLMATTSSLIVSIGSVLDPALGLLGLSTIWARGVMVGGGVLAFLGVVGATDLLSPPRDRPMDELRSDTNRFLWGYCLWSVGLLGVGVLGLDAGRASMWKFVIASLVVSNTGAILALTGIGSLMFKLGTRSFEYRVLRSSRQGTGGMIVALLFLTGGAILTATTSLETLGWVIVRITQLMLLIGVIYLTVNAWWILRAVTRPPQSLRRILRVPD